MKFDDYKFEELAKKALKALESIVDRLVSIFRAIARKIEYTGLLKLIKPQKPKMYYIKSKKNLKQHVKHNYIPVARRNMPYQRRNF